MKPKPGDTPNGSTEMRWMRVLRIANRDEFQQSFAVAHLAVKLWKNKMAKLGARPVEKENREDNGPKEFLEEAWKLIESAREHVLREQTDAEYLAVHGRSLEAAECVVGRRLKASLVPFHRLCDPERKKFDTKWSNGIQYDTKRPKTETINGVEWKVLTSVRAFDNLFRAYWSECEKHWKNATPAKTKKDDNQRAVMAKLASNADTWKRRGESVLASWKRVGVPVNTFLDLAGFRKERDNRSENLNPKPKPKRWRKMPKART